MKPGLLVASVGLVCACTRDGSPHTVPPPLQPPPKHSSSSAPEPAMPPPPPQPARKAQEHRFGLDDAALLQTDVEYSEALYRQVSDGFEGMAIDVAFAVDPAIVDRLPVHGVFARTPSADETFEDDAVVIAVDLELDVVRGAKALMTDKRLAERADGPSIEAFMASTFSFELNEVLHDFPWTTGKHRVYVLHRDAMSQGVTVQIGSNVGPGTEPAALDVMSLTAPGTVHRGGGATCMLEGAAPAGRAGDATNVHIVGVGIAGPFIATIKAHEGGRFLVDAMAHKDLPSGAGTWHFYAFAGEYAAGPVTVTITDA